MSRKKTKPTSPPSPTLPEWTAFWKNQPEISGSKYGPLTAVHTSRLLGALWHGTAPDPARAEIRQKAALQTVAEIGPRDVLEGMLAAQLVATHEAAMECFRRAMLPEQTFEGRQLALKHGDKLVRSFAALSEALDRHRGKGQQVVRVEHVTVQAGGQAIVGTVTPRAGGGAKSEEQCHAQQQQLAHAPEPALRGPDAQGQPVPVAGGEG